MSTYYINAGSTSPDGLSPHTGHHNFSNLLTDPGITLLDGDVISVVDNGIIDDTSAVLGSISTILTIQAISSYSRPVIKLASGSSSFSNNLTLTGLKFLATNANVYISVYGTTIVTNCVFDRTFLNIVNGTGHYIYNNIFANIADGNTSALTINNDVEDYAIVNNTFYNDAYGLFVQSTSGTGKILNNIFNNIIDNNPGGGVCILCYNTPTSVTIDYNNFYPDPGRAPTPSYVWWTSAPISVGTTVHNYYFGTNNSFTDTKLVNAASDDFYLDPSSPCIDTGIGHNIEGVNPAEPSIPIIDIMGESRPFNVHTDIGAYEYVGTTTTAAPTTTTTAAPTTTTTAAPTTTTTTAAPTTTTTAAPTTTTTTAAPTTTTTTAAPTTTTTTAAPTTTTTLAPTTTTAVPTTTTASPTTTTLAPTTTTAVPTTTAAPIVHPVISGQKSIPKVYVRDYVTINLNSLIVTTTKVYPGEFMLNVQPNRGYDIISTTRDSAKIQISGDKSTGGTRQVPLTVFDGTSSSSVYNYEITILSGQVKKGIPIGYNVGNIRRR